MQLALLLLLLLATALPSASSSSPNSTTTTRRLRGGGDFFRYSPLHYERRLTAGTVRLLAGPTTGNWTRGSADGIYTDALFSDPYGSSLSSDDSYLLVADYGNHKIRKIVLSTKAVTTLVGPSHGTTASGSTNGVGTNVRFTEPVGVRLASDDSFAYVVESGGHKIRKIVISTLAVTTVAGSTAGTTDGAGTNSKFSFPSDVCFSSDSSYALITDTGSNRIRKLTLSTSAVVGFAGSNSGVSGSANGIGSNSRFSGPYGIALAPGGAFALVTDSLNKLIRRIVITTLAVTTLIGSTTSSGTADGIGTSARLYLPAGIAISSDSSYAAFVGGSHRLRKLDLTTNAVTTIAGQSLSGDLDGIGTNAMFKYPISVSIFTDLGWFVVVDQLGNKVKIVAALDSSTLTPTLAPSVTPTLSPSGIPSSLPTCAPSVLPTLMPSSSPSSHPTPSPSTSPTAVPSISFAPTLSPSYIPSLLPSLSPSLPHNPTFAPTDPSSGGSGSTSSDGELSDGALAGVIVGGVVGVGALAALGFYFVPHASALYAPTLKITPVKVTPVE